MSRGRASSPPARGTEPPAGGRQPGRTGARRAPTPVASGAAGGRAVGSRARTAGLLFAGMAVLGAVAVLTSRPAAPRALFVDQLDLTHPNPAFVAAATGILADAGLAVDYVPGRDVTVDLYRNLPARPYDLILLRSHSARRAASVSELADDVTLFTAERFTWSRHADAIRSKRVGAVYNEFEYLIPTHEAAHWASAVPPVTSTPDSGELFDGRKLFFGIRGGFIETDLNGRFERSPLVILMGCDGLRSTRMAEAFVGKGARAFVSWDQPVSPERTDVATEDLLRRLYVDDLPVPEAVAATMAAIGPDADHGSTLTFFPR